MEPFRITFELAEPVLVNRSIAFDGILAHRTFLRTGDAGTAHRSLPLERTDGVYHASELLFLGPVRSRKVHFVMNPRWERFEPGALSDRRGKPLDRITARNGRKPVLDRYDALSARRAFVVGTGDTEAIDKLIAGLDGVGKKARSRGFGRLKDVRIERLDTAPDGLGLVGFDGRPARVVPADTWTRTGWSSEDVSFGPARPRLPRWATEDEPCALPASHVVQPHELHRVGL